MVSYKLDKYDKYFVAFVLVIMVIFNISHCFAVEDIPEGYNLIAQNVLINGAYLNDGGVVQNDNANVYYIDISNFDSVLYFNTKALKYFLSDSIDFNIGDTTPSSITQVQSNTEGIYLDTSSISQKYIIIAYFIDNSVQVYGKDYSGMSEGVNGLVENVGFNQLWSVFENGIDFVGVVVLVAFGLFLIVLLVKKLSKGKSDF